LNTRKLIPEISTSNATIAGSMPFGRRFTTAPLRERARCARDAA
jgi:hypothetical protein